MITGIRQINSVMLFVVMALAVLAFAVSACGEGEETTTTEAEGTNGTEATETTEDSDATEDPGTAEAEAPSGAPIVIGTVGPFTGPAGFLGEWTGNSIRILVEEKNEAGGLLGRPLKVETRDDALDPAKTVSYTRELASMDNLGMLVGPTLTSNFLAAKSVIVENEIVNGLNIVSGTDALDGAPYSFRNINSTGMQAEAVVAYVAENLEETKVGGIYADDETGRHIADFIEPMLADYGLEYTRGEFVDPDGTDYLNQVKRVRDSEAEIVLVPPVAPITSKAMLAMQQIEWNPQLIGWGLQTATLAETGGEQLNGAIFNDTAIWNRLGNVSKDEWPPLYREHYDKVKAEYGTQDVGGISQPKGEFGAAEIVYEYCMAVEEAGSLDAQAVTEAWESIELEPEETYFGVPVSYGPDDHEGWSVETSLVYQWQMRDDGTFEIVMLKGPTS